MNYFKTKLIITHVIVFITFHDVYGTEDQLSSSSRPVEGSPSTHSRLLYGEQSPTENLNPENQNQDVVFISLDNENYEFEDVQQTPFRTQQTLTTKVCVAILHEAEMYREHNYIESYLDIFNEVNARLQDYSLYDRLYPTVVQSCLMYPYSILNNRDLESDLNSYEESAVKKQKTENVKEDQKKFDPLKLFKDSSNNHETRVVNTQKTKENIQSMALTVVNSPDIGIDIAKMFFCDIATTVHDIYNIQNAFEYCNVNKNNPYHLEDQGVHTCDDELKNAGFIFEHGIDNYALLMLFEPEVEVLIDDDMIEGFEKIKSDILHPTGLIKTPFGKKKYPVNIYKNSEAPIDEDEDPFIYEIIDAKHQKHGEDVIMHEGSMQSPASNDQKNGEYDKHEDKDQKKGENDKQEGQNNKPPEPKKPQKSVMRPIEEVLTVLQKQYIAYLKSEIKDYPKNNKYKGYTTIWCMCMECEKDLHSSGFKSRDTGKKKS